MQKFLVFAGTTEGRRALELLAGPNRALWASAATEYGGLCLPELPGLSVLTGRLGTDEISALLARELFTCVLDATHPFAAEATKAIRAACEQTNTRYVRVLREETPGGEDCLFVQDTAEAVRFLVEHTTGNVLLSTGSKELEAFAAVPGYRERLFPRVLPVGESLEKCTSLGFAAKNIICMQGPFTAELNAAMLRQIKAAWLVTKETGAAGGFPEKCEGARRAGAKVIVIGRPEEAKGVTITELPAWLWRQFGIFSSQGQVEERAENAPVPPEAALYFPLFLSLAGKQVVVAGAGHIAARRAKALLGFGCSVRVIAPDISGEMSEVAEDGAQLLCRRYEPGDCTGAALVVAATSERETNAAIAHECGELNIPVSVADCKEQSTFYFPGLASGGSVTIGVTAGGSDHRLARRLTEKIRLLLPGLLADEGEETK